MHARAKTAMDRHLPRHTNRGRLRDSSGRAVSAAAHRSDALSRVLRAAPAMVAVVEPGAPVPGASAGSPDAFVALDGDAGIPALSFALTTDTVEVTLEAPTAGVLVVNEAWYPGWEATVDGVAAEVFRVNGFVRGVAVPAGAEAVSMSFRPSDGRALRWLLLLGWLGAAALLLPRGRLGSRSEPA